jgi:ribA/ribD-fused uncharacterized protein
MNPEKVPLADLKVFGFWSHREFRYPKDRQWFACFSNWYPSQFKLRFLEENDDDASNPEVTFCSMEQWIMWIKAKHFKDEETAKLIIQETDPGKIKALGRRVRNYQDKEWARIRFDVCLRGLKAKFTQDPVLRENLIRTDEKILAEASPKDTIWGIGLAPTDWDTQDEDKWRGLNLLGSALMEARDFLHSTN